MKVPVVFLLAVLSCSPAEGKIVSKCELRDELVKAIGNTTDKQNELIGEDLVAKLVCYVERVSSFSTSAVKNWGNSNPTQHSWTSVETSSTTQPAPSTESPSPNLQTERLRRSLHHEEVAYGLFQLSNNLVCSDDTSSSSNICGLDCSSLVDDNIEDDIICFLKIITNVEAILGVDPLKLKQLFKLIFQDPCRDIKASLYFAECP